MNYPELDLEAAQNGAPVIMLIEPNNEQIGYIYKSHQAKDTWIFENTAGECWPEIEYLLIEKTRMYVKPIAFEHWDIFSESCTNIQRLKHDDGYYWRVCKNKIDNETLWLREDMFAEGFFPDCKANTIITRPNQKVTK